MLACHSVGRRINAKLCPQTLDLGVPLRLRQLGAEVGRLGQEGCGRQGRIRADCAALTELSARRDKLASDVEDVSRRHATAQAQLATLVDDMAARNREFAELDGRVQAARRELAAVQGQLADARAQLSGQPAIETPSAPIEAQNEQTGTVTPQQ
jgi:chromosome segregation ATPase